MAPYYVPQDAPQGSYPPPYPYPYPGRVPQQPPQPLDPRRSVRPPDPGASSGFGPGPAATGSYPMPSAVPGRGPDLTRPGTRKPIDHTGATGPFPAKKPAVRPARTDPTLYEWDRLSPEQQQAVLETIGGARAAERRSSRRTALVMALVAVLALALLATVVAAVILSRAHVLGGI